MSGADYAFADTHAHLDSRRYRSDLNEVLDRARERGVGTIVTVGADLQSSRSAVRLAGEHGLFATVGVHPHSASEVTQRTIDELRRLAAAPRVVAIGEIGLDFYRNLSPPDRQREAFAQQLQLAVELNLPVVIHDRQAHYEVLDILVRELPPGYPVIMHCFSGDNAVLATCVEREYFISFAGPITYGNADQLRAVGETAPLEQILIETDCPYLAPHPFRGKRNEPCYVVEVASALAAARNQSLAEIAAATVNNAVRAFRLNEHGYQG